MRFASGGADCGGDGELGAHGLCAGAVGKAGGGEVAA